MKTSKERIFDTQASQEEIEQLKIFKSKLIIAVSIIGFGVLVVSILNGWPVFVLVYLFVSFFLYRVAVNSAIKLDDLNQRVKEALDELHYVPYKDDGKAKGKPVKYSFTRNSKHKFTVRTHLPLSYFEKKRGQLERIIGILYIDSIAETAAGLYVIKLSHRKSYLVGRPKPKIKINKQY